MRLVMYIDITDRATAAIDETQGGKRCARSPETAIALGCALICILWAVLCLIANTQITSRPKPCAGCGNCSVDLRCKKWSAAVQEEWPLSHICPPAEHPEDSSSNVTFSCVADAAWMFVTATFALFWALCLLRKPRRALGHANQAADLQLSSSSKGDTTIASIASGESYAAEMETV